DFAQDAVDPVDRQRPLLTDDVAESPPWHVLHDQGESSGREPTDRIEGDDAGVIEAGHHARLPEATREGLVVVLVGAVDDLDGHVALEDPVASAIDRGRRAAPDFGDDLELLETGNNETRRIVPGDPRGL